MTHKIIAIMGILLLAFLSAGTGIARSQDDETPTIPAGAVMFVSQATEGRDCLVVYDSPSDTANEVQCLPLCTKVVLTGATQENFVEISAPVAGWVDGLSLDPNPNICRSGTPSQEAPYIGSNPSEDPDDFGDWWSGYSWYYGWWWHHRHHHHHWFHNHRVHVNHHGHYRNHRPGHHYPKVHKPTNVHKPTHKPTTTKPTTTKPTTHKPTTTKSTTVKKPTTTKSTVKKPQSTQRLQHRQTQPRQQTRQAPRQTAPRQQMRSAPQRSAPARSAPSHSGGGRRR
jgi:hypothetical protein